MRIHVSPWPAALAEGLAEQDLAEGRKALEAIHLLRKAKTERQSHIGAPIEEAVIHAPADEIASLSRYSREIASAVRAGRVSFLESDMLEVAIVFRASS